MTILQWQTLWFFWNFLTLLSSVFNIILNTWFARLYMTVSKMRTKSYEYFPSAGGHYSVRIFMRVVVGLCSGHSTHPIPHVFAHFLCVYYHRSSPTYWQTQTIGEGVSDKLRVKVTSKRIYVWKCEIQRQNIKHLKYRVQECSVEILQLS